MKVGCPWGTRARQLRDNAEVDTGVPSNAGSATPSAAHELGWAASQDYGAGTTITSASTPTSTDRYAERTATVLLDGITEPARRPSPGQ